jgi:trigger factor
LKIETQYLDDHQAKLVVEIDSDQMEDMKRRAARKIARKVKIPGFRPGKAPYAVIARQIGEAVILEEAIEILVNDIYPKVIDEAGINPYGPGSLENVNNTDPPVLEFVVPLEAEVTLGDYQSLRKPYELEAVTDNDINEVLENLRERQAIIEPVDRSAETGDLVTVQVSATRAQPEEGQDPILIQERSAQIIIRDDSRKQDEDENAVEANEWPYPGFAQHLKGLSAGDEERLQYTYPNDAEPAAYRGVEAEFLVKVESVKVRTLPELDDEFAKSLGDYDDLDALRNEIRTMLASQAEQSYNENYDEEILGEVIDLSTIKYPPQMLEHEIDHVISNLEERLKQQGLDMDLYLKTRSMDSEGLREDFSPTAETRLKRTLVLLELAKAEKLQVDPDQVQAEAQSTLNYFEQTLPKKEARKLSNQRVYSSLVSNIISDMLINNSMERLRNIFRGIVDEQEPSEPAETENGDTEIELPQEDVVSAEVDEPDTHLATADVDRESGYIEPAVSQVETEVSNEPDTQETEEEN